MRAIIVVAVLCGCVKSDAIECSNGIVCPSDTLCDDANGGCIVAAQITPCEGVIDPIACTWTDGAGECVNGVCLPHVCGDGRRSGPERCDPTDANANTTTCDSEELGYYEGGDVACAADCTWNTNPCSMRCGDGAINGNEVCEIGVPPTDTCFQYGFDRGELGCAACGPSFETCAFIGWQQRPVGGSPARVVAVGADLFAVLDNVGSFDLAVRYLEGAWVGLGTLDLGAPNPAAYAIAATGPTNVLVGGTTNDGAGDVGFLARHDGTAWSLVKEFPLPVVALWAHGSHIFTIDGTTLNIFDGATWTTQALAASTPGFWISGTSPTDVWVSGTQLWHGGAGQTFTTMTLPVAGQATGIHAFGPDQVAVAVHLAANTITLLVRTGGNWTQIPYPATGNVVANPYVRAPDDIFLQSAGPITIGVTLPTVGHYNGTSWVYLTDATQMQPSALTGSPEAGVIALDRSREAAFHYQGSVWNPVNTPPDIMLPAIGGTATELYVTDAFSSLSAKDVYRFDGKTWTQQQSNGVLESVDGLVFAIDVNQPSAYSNPTLWRRTGPTTNDWASYDLPTNINDDPYVEFIGVLGATDVFLADAIGGIVRYRHWAGTSSDVTALETTNLPDSAGLTIIDCKPGVGCYAGGPGANNVRLWRTPGDRNAWTQVVDVDVGTVTAIWIASASHVVVGGTQGRIAHFDGTAWTVTKLPTGAAIEQVTGTSATDVFALTSPGPNEQQLFHWDGAAWTRVRLPVSGFGSLLELLWSNGRQTFVGNTTTPIVLESLVRTDAW